jgi:hypothetical protein
MILLLLLLSTKHTHGTEWDCTGASNTGTFQRSTGCTISGTSTSHGGGVVVTNTLEIVGTVEDMNNLIVITAPSKQRHFYINGVNDKLVLRYLKLIGGSLPGKKSNTPNGDGGSICIWSSGGTLLLYSSIIANNQAVGKGAGIFATGTNNIVINQTIIHGNKAHYGGGLYISNSNCKLVRTKISKNTAEVAGGLALYKDGSSSSSTTVEIRETTFTANIGNEIYTHGAPITISIVNTLFNEPVDSNSVFTEASGHATWNTCANNVCTDTPFTGTCTAVNNANTKYGVLCSKNYNSKCSPGTSLIVSGAEIGGCNPCVANHYSTDGIICKPCTGGKMSPPGSPKCYNIESMLQNVRSLGEQQGGIIKAVALSNAKSNEVKRKANGLIAKLSLDWATQDVINKAQKLRNQLSLLPEYNVKHHCEQEKQRLAYGVLRTGIVVPTDAEIDDKYCLNENRDRLISSFCNFRPRFIKLLQEKLYPRLPSTPKYTGRDLWPNICCRKDNFQHLQTCNDPSGKVPRSHIVPFALAQGGNITVDNLYGEIVDVLKKDGYLQQGMSKAVDGIKDADKLQQKINNLFETTLLCGPREFGLPTNEGIRLCELFYPYEHMLTTYYNEVNTLLEPLQRRRRRRMLGVWSGISNLMNSATAFVFGDADADGENIGVRKLQDEIDMLKRKDAILEKKEAMSHSNIKTLKQQVNKTNTFLSTLKRNGVSKRRLGSTSDALCPFVTMSDVSEYEKDIDTFCTGYAHIDLNHPGTVINLAIMTPWDIPPKMIPELREKARYEISDDCPTPMFTAKDISLQNIDGTDLFVVQLDATSPNGYLRQELPQCGAANNVALRPHIPKTTIDVKVWRDHEDCCKDTKDYKVCKAIKCLPTDDPNGIEPVKDAWTGQQVGYHYKVIGTTYTATCDNKPNSKPCGSTRRRSLLQDEYGNSGERL